VVLISMKIARMLLFVCLVLFACLGQGMVNILHDVFGTDMQVAAFFFVAISMLGGYLYAASRRFQ